MAIELAGPALLGVSSTAMLATGGIAAVGLGAAYLYTHPEVRAEIADSAQSAWATLEAMAAQTKDLVPILHMSEKKPPAEGADGTTEPGPEIDPDGPDGDTLPPAFGEMVGIATGVLDALGDFFKKKN